MSAAFPDEAIADFDRAITLDPLFGRAHFRRAGARQALPFGDERQWLGDFDRAVELEPNFVPAHLHRAAACVMALNAGGRECDRALASADKACELTDHCNRHCLMVAAADIDLIRVDAIRTSAAVSGTATANESDAPALAEVPDTVSH